jgi:hypothetical protein
MSPRRSAPQTLHLLRLSLDPNPSVRPRGTSRLLRLLESDESELSEFSAASASACSCASLSASSAASSASGESGIVSRLEMLGLRDRVDVGVDGIDEPGIDEPGPHAVGKVSYGRWDGEQAPDMPMRDPVLALPY